MHVRAVWHACRDSGEHRHFHVLYVQCNNLLKMWVRRGFNVGVGADWCWGVGDVEGKWWVHGRDRARTEQALIATVLHTPNVRASGCLRKLAKLRGPMSPRHRRGVGLLCRLRTHAHTHTICRARAHAHHAHMHTIQQRGLSSTNCLPRSWSMHLRD